MLSISEFNEAAVECNRRYSRFWIRTLLGGTVVQFAVPLIAWALFAPVAGVAASVGVLVPGLVTMLAVCGTVMLLAARWRPGVPAADCPHCGRTIALDLDDRWTVVATRRCVKCGALVVSEPEPEPDVPLTRLEDVQRVERKRDARLFPAALVALGVLLGGFFAGLYIVDLADGPEAIADGYARTLGHVGGQVAMVVVVLSAVFILPIGLVVLLGVGLSSLGPQPPACPHCGWEIQSLIVEETGNCGGCGRRVLADPEPAVGVAGGGPVR